MPNLGFLDLAVALLETRGPCIFEERRGAPQKVLKKFLK
jgi:hypothetical protein